jgi:predicted PurR-regulated permease PerM
MPAATQGRRVRVLGLFLGPTLLAVGYELIREWKAVERKHVETIK